MKRRTAGGSSPSVSTFNAPPPPRGSRDQAPLTKPHCREPLGGGGRGEGRKASREPPALEHGFDTNLASNRDRNCVHIGQDFFVVKTDHLPSE